jgi:hypothetical protein
MQIESFPFSGARNGRERGREMPCMVMFIDVIKSVEIACFLKDLITLKLAMDFNSLARKKKKYLELLNQ